jgi:hypothetical protein
LRRLRWRRSPWKITLDAIALIISGHPLHILGQQDVFSLRKINRTCDGASWDA